MRALVTGVAGFIGSHLAERLVSGGATVTGVDALTAYYDPALKHRNLASLRTCSNFQFVEGDLNELGVSELVEDVDVVFHFAGQPGVRGGFGREFEHYVRANTLATQTLLEASARTNVEKVVFASSSSVYGEAGHFPTLEADPLRPVSPYGITKVAAEGLCRLYQTTLGVPVVCLRYFTVYGPRQRPDMAFSRFIDAALDGRHLTIHGDGGQSRDFTFVDDAVDAAVAAAERGVSGGVYNVAGGSPVTLLEAVSLMAGLLGMPLDIEHGAACQSEPRRTGADGGAARRDLDFAPRTTLRAGLTLQIEHRRALRAASAELQGTSA